MYGVYYIMDHITYVLKLICKFLLLQDYTNFLSYVCKAYQGTDAPQICTEASFLSTVREVEAKTKHSFCAKERVMPTLETIRSTITSWMNFVGAV